MGNMFMQSKISLKSLKIAFKVVYHQHPRYTILLFEKLFDSFGLYTSQTSTMLASHAVMALGPRFIMSHWSERQTRVMYNV